MKEGSSVASVLQALAAEARRLAPGARMPSVRSLMERRGHAAARIDQEASEGIRHAHPAQRFFLDTQRRRMHHHRAREHRRHARMKTAGAELREGVMPAIGQHHVVAGLRAAPPGLCPPIPLPSITGCPD